MHAHASARIASAGANRVTPGVLEPRAKPFVQCIVYLIFTPLHRYFCLICSRPRVPRPTATRALDIALFEFLGQLFGAAVRTRTYLDLNLPSIVWRQLVQQPVTEADVLAIDVLSFKIVEQLEELARRCDADGDAGACFGQCACC